ncbi:MAG: YccF domain-containing protein [Ornithinimicrobium sp.]
MRTLGNILWLVLAGWWLALTYLLAGVIACVLIITIPFGVASFRLANYVLWPFGRRTVFRQEAGIFSVVGNVVWILVLGWELALAHVVAGLLLCLTIIGIPFGVACWKMVPLAFVPLGQRIVQIEEPQQDPFAGAMARGT